MNGKRSFYLMSWVSILVATGILTVQPLYAQPAGNSVDIKFLGLKNTQGQICIKLFSGSKGFPSGGADSDLVIARCSPIVEGAAMLTLDELKPGDYALIAHHDLNNDGTMNKGAFGIPEEGFGFSNNPEIGFSSPSFEETKFSVSDPKTTVQVLMRYLN